MKNILSNIDLIKNATINEVKNEIIKEFENPKKIFWIDNDNNQKEQLDNDYYIKMGRFIYNYTSYNLDKDLFEWCQLQPNEINIEILVSFLQYYWLKKSNVFYDGIDFLISVFSEINKDSVLYILIMYLFSYSILFEKFKLSDNMNKKILNIIKNEISFIENNIKINKTLLIDFLNQIKNRYNIS